MTRKEEESITVWFTRVEMAQIRAYCTVGGFNRSAIIRKALAMYMATQPVSYITPAILPTPLVDLKWE